jgi:hypothetical protein
MAASSSPWHSNCLAWDQRSTARPSGVICATLHDQRTGFVQSERNFRKNGLQSGTGYSGADAAMAFSADNCQTDINMF